MRIGDAQVYRLDNEMHVGEMSGHPASQSRDRLRPLPPTKESVMNSCGTPWFKEGSGIAALVRDCQGRIVACRHRMGAKENEDQMTLIAAAPDLLSALERMALAFRLLL